MMIRSLLLEILVLGATPLAWGQVPPFGVLTGHGNDDRALRESLDQAWSVVNPSPAPKIEKTEIEPPHPTIGAVSEKPVEITPSKVIRRKSGPSTESSSESRDSSVAGTTTGASWIRTLGSLAGVVAMILFLAWGAKSVRNVGGGVMRARKTGLIEVMSRTSISAKQSICLVRVGSRMVLIGVTPERLQALDVITDADTVATLAGDAAKAERVGEDRAFMKRLENEGARYLGEGTSASPSKHSESANALRERLKSSVARLRKAAVSK